MADTLDVLDPDEAATGVGQRLGTRWEAHLPRMVTAVSRRLDRLVGPIVQRTVTDEAHDGGWPSIFLRHHPNVSITTLTEYAGTVATVLTAETVGTVPVDAYRTTPYSHDPALLGNEVVRRSGGADARFPSGRGNVVVTYVAGRSATTAAVDDLYKEAAVLILKNHLRTRQPNIDAIGDLEDARPITPGFEIPNMVRELLEQELQDPLPLATR